MIGRSESESEVVCAESAYGVPVDADRLATFDSSAAGFALTALITALQRDQVVLVQNVPEADADRITGDVAQHLGLRVNLQMQAAFAGMHGHRENVSQYFMTVNRRNDYDIVLPHSEGTRFANIQLASLYCHQNTTDGGTTILLNTDERSPMWGVLRELVSRLDRHARKLTAMECATARVRCQVDPCEDILSPEDTMIQERESPLAGVRFFWALTKLRKRRSVVLERDVHTYWDSVCTADADAVGESVRLMSSLRLLKEPPAGGPRVNERAMADSRKVWSSGVSYESLFKAMIVRRLLPGELIIQNNLTWTHAASNWTPGSGSRRIVAAFA